MTTPNTIAATATRPSWATTNLLKKAEKPEVITIIKTAFVEVLNSDDRSDSVIKQIIWPIFEHLNKDEYRQDASKLNEQVKHIAKEMEKYAQKNKGMSFLSKEAIAKDNESRAFKLNTIAAALSVVVNEGVATNIYTGPKVTGQLSQSQQQLVDNLSEKFKCDNLFNSDYGASAASAPPASAMPDDFMSKNPSYAFSSATLSAVPVDGGTLIAEAVVLDSNMPIVESTTLVQKTGIDQFDKYFTQVPTMVSNQFGYNVAVSTAEYSLGVDSKSKPALAGLIGLAGMALETGVFGANWLVSRGVVESPIIRTSTDAQKSIIRVGTSATLAVISQDLLDSYNGIPYEQRSSKVGLFFSMLAFEGIKELAGNFAQSRVDAFYNKKSDVDGNVSESTKQFSKSFGVLEGRGLANIALHYAFRDEGASLVSSLPKATPLNVVATFLIMLVTGSYLNSILTHLRK
jgi:hypothetical protein